MYSSPRREKTRCWETSFRSLFTGQTSYLLGLSGSQSLDSYRVETQSRLGSNQSLILTGYETNHDDLRYKRKCTVSTPSSKKCGHLWKRASGPHRVQGKSRRRRQDQRSSTPQDKDSIDKTTRMVIDTVDESDDNRLTNLDHPLQGERRQDVGRRHSDLYSPVKPVIYSDLVVLSHWTVIE